MASKKKPNKPLDSWIPRKKICLSLGISTQAFDNWNVPQAGKLGRESFYTLDDIIANREARLAARHADEVKGLHAAIDDATGGSLAEKEKLLLTREQRIGQELKNAQTRRELAPVSVIDWTLSKVGSQIAAILESIPMKVKKLLPKLTAAEIEHVRREVIKAQNAAARVTVDLDEYYERDPDGNREIDPGRTKDA